MRIAINNKGRILFIKGNDIYTVVAQGNYVVLDHASGPSRFRESISAMAKKLEPYGFVRIHRSVVVNRSYVREILPYKPGSYLVRLKNGKEFTTTRTYKRNLRSLAEIWLGDETLIGAVLDTRS